MTIYKNNYFVQQFALYEGKVKYKWKVQNS